MQSAFRWGYKLNNKTINYLQIAESIGVICGIIGAFLVANAMPTFGYPLFAISSLMLTYSAFNQKNWNLVALQFTFLIANINGLITYFWN